MKDQIIEAPIKSVTVLEDRAQVTRRVQCQLPRGTTRCRIVEVAPVIVDRTVSIRAGGATVTDAKVHRILRPLSAHPERVQELEARVLELVQEETAQRARLERLEKDAQSVEIIAGALVKEVGEDAAWGELRKGFAEELAEVEQAALERRVEVKQAQGSLGLLLQRLEDTRRELAVAKQKTDTWRADLCFSFVAGADFNGELTIEYVVPAAAWRPAHRAKMGEGDRIDWSVEGFVWQATGEDWTDVELVLSTHRPSGGVDAPTLTEDRLWSQPRAHQVTVEYREQEEQEVQGSAGKVGLPGVDDGGEVRVLKAATSQTIKSDGRPNRVPLFSMTSAASRTRVCMPELALGVFTKTSLANQADSPLLAGPVELVEGGGVLGFEEIGYVAPSEKFDLGWGIDPGVSVRRKAYREEGDLKWYSGWVHEPHRVKIHISNTGGSRAHFALHERLPVSELELIEVHVDPEYSTEGYIVGNDGILEWTVDIEPGTNRSFDLAYVIKRHRDVVGA